MTSSDFTCQVCGKKFSLPEQTLAQYPGWTPKYCSEHSPKRNKSPAQLALVSAPSLGPEEMLPVAEVLKKYSAGPQTGIFTDGSARPNPGPGGWGMVHVENGKILRQDHGHDPATTNNRMELTALIQAYRSIAPDTTIDIYTDSELCVNTITKWAAGWEKRDWKRKGGPIKNLELVQELYGLAKEHPRASLRWIAAHNGWLWNEYADSLSTAWAREIL